MKNRNDTTSLRGEIIPDNPYWENTFDRFKTRVIFRRFNGGEIIALFPHMPGNESPYTCGSYMHVGQHGTADPMEMMHRTNPAKPSEYNDLFLELTHMGYNLEVRQRTQYRDIEIRRVELTGMNHES